MKTAIATIVSACVGMLAGVTLWTIFAIVLLLLYWVGYVFLFLGVVCGRPGGRGFGLGLMDAPEDGQVSMEYVTLLTAFAFTWGEILAGLIGAMCGGAVTLGGIKIVRRIFARR